MTKTQIQTERMLRYFLDATKNIIRSEGIDALSVRSIADKAGYSYATIYNYYKDVKELTSSSAIEFIAECKEYVLSQATASNDAKQNIHHKSMAYAQFFIQYGGIYQLLFITSPTNTGNVSSLSEELIRLHNDIFGTDFEKLFQDSCDMMLSMHVNLLCGALLNYLNRRNPESYTEFRNNMISQINLILKKD